MCKLYRSFICKALLALLFFSHQYSLSAQERHEATSFSLGLTQSLKGAGISMAFDRDGMISALAIMTDFHNVLNGKSVIPGARIRYNSLFPIANAGSIDGNPISFYAGPGLVVGMVQDKRDEFGLSTGLNVAAGFSVDIRYFTMCLEFDSDIAIFMTRGMRNREVITTLYHNGLIRAYYPSIKIEYKF